jgi:hypothetical protein
MAVENKIMTWTFKAQADIDDLTAGSGDIFKAVSNAAGDIASTGQDAIGILQFVGKDTEHVTFAHAGISKFTVNAAISSADVPLTVTTSGYFAEADSGDYVVGKFLEGTNRATTLSSGSVGTGLFNFANKILLDSDSGHIAAYEVHEFSAKADLSTAGDLNKAISINDGDFADTSNDADGVLYTGTVSGGTSAARMMGKLDVRAGNVITINRSLKVTSGWFLDADSGDLIVGRALAASAAGNSGGTVAAVVNFATPHYATSCLDVQY